ncbi:MAG: hypothetical protein LUQ65_09825, partial [Candidatus Helarchaeota archaeon]|nr:hypothetical protein [Candidatus Helarchaeota archaeon]
IALKVERIIYDAFTIKRRVIRLENLVIKTLDLDFVQFQRLIENFQNKSLKDGAEKGRSITEEQITFSFGRLYLDAELLLGMYYQNKLLAILGAAPSVVKFQGEVFKAAGIGGWGLDPIVLLEYTKGESLKDNQNYEKNQTRIFRLLLDEIISRATAKKFDLLYAFPVADEIKSLSDFLQETAKWTVLNKNVENQTKLMGSEGVDILKEKRGLNILESQAAKLLAKMKQDRITTGVLRKATELDITKIVELLNGYSKIHEVARIWTLEEFQAYLKAFEALKRKKYLSQEEYPETPYGFDSIVWDDSGDIKATIIYEVNETFLKKGFAPILFIHQLAFSDEINRKEANASKKEKNDFMGSFLAPFHLKVCTAYALLPYYDEKAFDGFLGERRTTPLVAKALTEKANSVVQLKKLKKFYLNFVEFTVP